jgi:uncharacterized membrane protein YccC
MLGMVSGGLAVATGALNVSFSDSHDPYRMRARKMAAASVLVGTAVFLGASLGRHHTMAVLMAGLIAFVAGMLVSLSTTAADLGGISLVILVVYSSFPQTPERAAYAGLLAIGGGLLQTLLALAFWPIRRYVPERRALADLFRELAKAAAAPVQVLQAPPASAESTRAQTLLEGLHRDHSVQAERYLILLSQAERIRLRLLTLGRLRTRMQREGPEGAEVQAVTRFSETAAQILEPLANCVAAGDLGGTAAESLAKLSTISDELRAIPADGSEPRMALIADSARQTDALCGQIRAAVEVAGSATTAGLEAFDRREMSRPWRLRISGPLAILRANLHLNSAAFRHAVRLAVCVAGGEAMARGWGLHRSYWVPMTIAIVLKPDFTATFSRGLLRLTGTFAGLVLATLLFHLLPDSMAAQIALFAGLLYLLRWVGSANYGIFVTFLTALVVILIALSGISPKDVVAARAVNTIAGGMIALLAYFLWPTWERKLLPEALAQTLDAYRLYFHAIRQGYLDGVSSIEKACEGARVAARLARSNLEASVDRFNAEPFTPQRSVQAMSRILANSHRLIHALMALEAGLSTSQPVPARKAFKPFANHLELAMYLLAASLRGSQVELEHIPDLREDHHALTHSEESLTERYALVNVETDRITNSVNTLAEEILGWVSWRKAAR